MRTTLRRKTKVHEMALRAIKPGKIRCYSLNKSIFFDQWSPRKELRQSSSAKLYQDGNKITLIVNSNLWYEWDLT